jgi:transposase
MQAVSTIGLDLQSQSSRSTALMQPARFIRRQLKRRPVLAFFQKLPVCLVGIEACASSHYWSRELQALGHSVRLMPPAYVKPYVKRQKNDMAAAEAMCEAVARANMRFARLFSDLFPRQRRGDSRGAVPRRGSASTPAPQMLSPCQGQSWHGGPAAEPVRDGTPEPEAFGLDCESLPILRSLAAEAFGVHPWGPTSKLSARWSG